MQKQRVDHLTATNNRLNEELDQTKADALQAQVLCPAVHRPHPYVRGDLKARLLLPVTGGLQTCLARPDLPADVC